MLDPLRATSMLVLCRAYILAYNSHQLKHIFNVHRLDLLAVAKSFGFSAPPKVCFSPVSACSRACTCASFGHPCQLRWTLSQCSIRLVWSVRRATEDQHAPVARVTRLDLGLWSSHMA